MESQYGNTRREVLHTALECCAESAMEKYDNLTPSTRLFVDLFGALFIAFWSLVCLVIIL